MRNVWKAALLALMFSATAQATSFANRGLGLGVGFMRIFSYDSSLAPDFLVPLWLEGALYLESGFEAYARVPLALASVKIGAGTAGGAGLVFASGIQSGVRYLFLEETWRPYVFLHMSGIYVARTVASGSAIQDAGSNLLIGPGAGGGIEVFVADSVSLQARAFLDWFVGINCNSSFCQSFNVGGAVTASTYF